MAAGADTKENPVILRDVCYTIAILCPSTITLEYFMMGNWNLLEDRKVRNRREWRGTTGMKGGIEGKEVV